jgi:hypothetical protein
MGSSLGVLFVPISPFKPLQAGRIPRTTTRVSRARLGTMFRIWGVFLESVDG